MEVDCFSSAVLAADVAALPWHGILAYLPPACHLAVRAACRTLHAAVDDAWRIEIIRALGVPLALHLHASAPTAALLTVCAAAAGCLPHTPPRTTPRRLAFAVQQHALRACVPRVDESVHGGASMLRAEHGFALQQQSAADAFAAVVAYGAWLPTALYVHVEATRPAGAPRYAPWRITRGRSAETWMASSPRHSIVTAAAAQLVFEPTLTGGVHVYAHPRFLCQDCDEDDGAGIGAGVGADVGIGAAGARDESIVPQPLGTLVPGGQLFLCSVWREMESRIVSRLVAALPHDTWYTGVMCV